MELGLGLGPVTVQVQAWVPELALVLESVKAPVRATELESELESAPGQGRALVLGSASVQVLGSERAWVSELALESALVKAPGQGRALVLGSASVQVLGSERARVPGWAWASSS